MNRYLNIKYLNIQSFTSSINIYKVSGTELLFQERGLNHETCPFRIYNLIIKSLMYSEWNITQCMYTSEMY